MHIYIPTRGRVGQQHTLGALLADFVPYPVVLVCPEDEVHQHAYTTVVGCPARGIAATRQWIVDHCPERYVLMLDDDLHFFQRRMDDPTKFRDMEPGELSFALRQVEYLLTEAPHAAIAVREGGNRNTDPLLVNTRTLRALGYDIEVLRQHGIRFDAVPVMEDFYVSLSLLCAGYDNLTYNGVVHNQAKGSNAPGGCSVYRTPAVQTAAALELERHFPAYVKVIQKSTRVAWGGGTRTDVRIAWKRAREHTEQQDS